MARFLQRVAAEVAPNSQPVYLDRLALCLVTAERSVAARERALTRFRSERQWAWIRPPPPARDGASTPPIGAKAR